MFTSLDKKWKSVVEKNPVAEFIESILTGFSQLVLNDNSVCALIIVVAVIFLSPIQALSAIWTSIVAMIIIRSFGVDRKLVKHGLYTINAALAGMAMPMVMYKNNWNAVPQLLIYGAIAALMVTVITSCLRRILGQYQASPLALPFCFTIMIISGSHNLLATMDAVPLFTPKMMIPAEHIDVATNFANWDLASFGLAMLAGIAETIWVESIPNAPLIGVAVLIGIFINSRIAGLITIIFAAASTATAIALGLSKGAIHDGLYGYNAILIGLLAFGHAFRVSTKMFFIALALALVSIVFAAGLRPFTYIVGAPVAVFPFTILMICMMVGRKNFPKLEYIAPPNWGKPELSKQAPLAE